MNDKIFFWRKKAPVAPVKPAATPATLAQPEKLPPRPHIVCAAVKFSDNLVVASPRHMDSTMQAIMRRIPELENDCTYVEGFIDQDGKFYTRNEAYKIALLNGQIQPTTSGRNNLQSIHLY